MSKVVEVPGVGNVEFPIPCLMTISERQSKRISPLLPLKDQANQAVKDVATGAISKLNPIPGIVDTAKAIYGDPIGTAMQNAGASLPWRSSGPRKLLTQAR